MKRTQKQIEQDYIRIKEVSTRVTSFKELKQETGLSYAEILVSLKNHPKVYAKVKQKLSKRRVTSVKRCAPEEQQNTSKPKEKFVVIDASIMGNVNVENILLSEERKIILTSVTIKELALMQKYNDSDAMRARHILSISAEHDEKFVHKKIREDYETPDECIIKFCESMKDCVTLYTSDKEMYHLARLNEVDAKFIQASHDDKPASGLITFYYAKQTNDGLVIDLDYVNRKNKAVKVCSGGTEYDAGRVRLNVGDSIYMTSRKEHYFTFAHYKIVSAWVKDNCQLVYSAQIKKGEKTELPYEYKAFFRESKRKLA